MAKNSKPSVERRNAAREKARQLAEAQAKRERTSKIALRSGLLVVGVALLVLVGFLFWQAAQPAAKPTNFAANGISFAKGGQVVASPTAPEDQIPEGLAKPTAEQANEGAAHVQVYIDFQCPGCASFEGQYGEMLQGLAEDGSIVLEYKPIAILDSQSGGNNYSTRAANMMACASDVAPESFTDLALVMFANQPGEGAAGMTDEQLLGFANEAGIENDAVARAATEDDEAVTFEQCVRDETYSDAVGEATSAAADAGITGTPTVLINGEQSQQWGEGKEQFATEILRASGELSDPAAVEDATED